jgi:hypothetical protein
MKTNCLRIDRLIPVLGIALVAGGVMAAAAYFGLERKIDSGQAFAATLDRLYHDQKLAAVLKTLQEGDMDAAARRLDLMLCDDILAINSQLVSADRLQQVYAQDMFARMAKVRPRNSELTASAAQELSNDQIEAERILTISSVAIKPATEGLAALP